MWLVCSGFNLAIRRAPSGQEFEKLAEIYTTFLSAADSADNAQRQVRHQVEQQDADFKQRHASVVDGVEPFPG